MDEELNKRCSTGKTRYMSKSDATYALHTIAIKHKREKRPVRQYYCELCKGYHVSSNPGGTNKVRPMNLKYAKGFMKYIKKDEHE